VRAREGKKKKKRGLFALARNTSLKNLFFFFFLFCTGMEKSVSESQLL